MTPPSVTISAQVNKNDRETPMGRPASVTDDEFKEMRAQHLPYELLMLQHAAAILSERTPAASDVPANVRRWMAIEVFYIHLRNLDQFFYGDGGQETDALAIHFFDDPAEWRTRSNRPRRSAAMREAVELAGTMVAHLSYKRRRNIQSGKGLQWLKLSQEMDLVYEAFVVAMTKAGTSLPLNAKFSIVPRPPFVEFEIAYATATTVSTSGDVSSIFVSPTFGRSSRGRR
jgi:hypothetical protein